MVGCVAPSSCGLPRQTPNGAAAFFELSKKTAADVSGCAGEQDCVRPSESLISSFGSMHRVDDMDDAVARGDVGLDDARVVDRDAPVRAAMASVSPLTALAELIFMTSAAMTFPATT